MIQNHGSPCEIGNSNDFLNNIRILIKYNTAGEKTTPNATDVSILYSYKPTILWNSFWMYSS